MQAPAPTSMSLDDLLALRETDGDPLAESSDLGSEPPELDSGGSRVEMTPALARTGRVTLAFPLAPNHPRQAYTATASERRPP